MASWLSALTSRWFPRSRDEKATSSQPPPFAVGQAFDSQQELVQCVIKYAVEHNFQVVHSTSVEPSTPPPPSNSLKRQRQRSPGSVYVYRGELFCRCKHTRGCPFSVATRFDPATKQYVIDQVHLAHENHTLGEQVRRLTADEVSQRFAVMLSELGTTTFVKPQQRTTVPFPETPISVTPALAPGGQFETGLTPPTRPRVATNAVPMLSPVPTTTGWTTPPTANMFGRTRHWGSVMKASTVKRQRGTGGSSARGQDGLRGKARGDKSTCRKRLAVESTQSPRTAKRTKEALKVECLACKKAGVVNYGHRANSKRCPVSWVK